MLKHGEDNSWYDHKEFRGVCLQCRVIYANCILAGLGSAGQQSPWGEVENSSDYLILQLNFVLLGYAHKYL